MVMPERWNNNSPDEHRPEKQKVTPAMKKPRNAYRLMMRRDRKLNEDMGYLLAGFPPLRYTIGRASG